jgi:hypothetical protein
MPATIKKRPTKTDRAIRQLYITVDRVIQAADEARRARDKLIRLASERQRREGTADARR